MTTRRKGMKLRAYDYMEGFRIVTDWLNAAGESVKLTSTEASMVDHAIEIAAEQSMSNDMAERTMREVAAYIKKTRGRAMPEDDDSRPDTHGTMAACHDCGQPFVPAFDGDRFCGPCFRMNKL